MTTEKSEPLSKSQLKARGWTDAHIARLLADAPSATVTRRVAGYQRATMVYDASLIEQHEADDVKLAARIAQVSARKDAAKIEQATSGRVTFAKDDGEWVLMGSGLVEGETVMVFRRDGSSDEKTVGCVFGERDGMLLAQIGRARAARAPKPAAAPATIPTQESWRTWDGSPFTTDVKTGTCESCGRRRRVGLMEDMSGLWGWVCWSCSDHASIN